MKIMSILQKIEDKYIDLGYKGLALRRVLENDQEYQKALKERRQKLTKKFEVTKNEGNKYVLSTDIDYEILAICKQLEKQKLSNQDKLLVQMIKTQLDADWRTPLIKILRNLKRKYPYS